MNIYKLKIQSDTGVFFIKISADNKEKAKTRFINIEKCPDSAIVSIKKI